LRATGAVRRFCKQTPRGDSWLGFHGRRRLGYGNNAIEVSYVDVR
jgi:hypothetical protein